MYVFQFVFSPASGITLEDDSFPLNEFEPVKGLLSAQWDRINQYPKLQLAIEGISLLYMYIAMVCP